MITCFNFLGVRHFFILFDFGTSSEPEVLQYLCHFVGLDKLRQNMEIMNDDLQVTLRPEYIWNFSMLWPVVQILWKSWLDSADFWRGNLKQSSEWEWLWYWQRLVSSVTHSHCWFETRGVVSYWCCYMSVNVVPVSMYWCRDGQTCSSVGKLHSHSVLVLTSVGRHKWSSAPSFGSVVINKYFLICKKINPVRDWRSTPTYCNFKVTWRKK